MIDTQSYIKGSVRDLQNSAKIHSLDIQAGLATLITDCTLNFNLMGLENKDSAIEVLDTLQANDVIFNLYMRSVSAFLADKSLYGQTYIDYCNALAEIILAIRDTESSFDKVHIERAIPIDELKQLLRSNPWFTYYVTLHLDYTTPLMVIAA